MALNNQPAVLKVVENVVYFEIDVEPGIATGNTQSIPAIETTAKTVPVGLVMTVTPQVNENQSVTLNMRPTISSITQFVNDPSPDLAAANTTNPVPQIQVREMESVLKVQNGQIAVLGGLIQDWVRQDSNRVPLLSDLRRRHDLWRPGRLVDLLQGAGTRGRSAAPPMRCARRIDLQCGRPSKCSPSWMAPGPSTGANTHPMARNASSPGARPSPRPTPAEQRPTTATTDRRENHDGLHPPPPSWGRVGSGCLSCQN